MPTFKKNPSPFQMKGMSFKEGQSPMHKLSLGKVITGLGKGIKDIVKKFKEFKESDQGKKISKNLSAAGDKLSDIHVDRPDTLKGTVVEPTQDANVPDVTTIIASKDNPIKPIKDDSASEYIEEKSSAITKKSPAKNYKKGYYGA